MWKPTKLPGVCKCLNKSCCHARLGSLRCMMFDQLKQALLVVAHWRCPNEPCSIYIHNIVWSCHQWFQGEFWPGAVFWCSLKTLDGGSVICGTYSTIGSPSCPGTSSFVAMAMSCKVKRSDLYLQVYIIYAICLCLQALLVSTTFW